MGIHEYIETILFGDTKHRDCMTDPLLVIFSWSSMFDSLPSEDIADRIVTPSRQPCEMCMSVGQGEWASDKGDIVTVEEVVGNVGWLVRHGRKLCICSSVDTMQSDLAVVLVAKGAAINAEA